ncbi:MAG: asparagine synthase (glutamine-hydrolyzing) [Myxococcota bacterium]|nr:asparagine synthase (glutamine-hydrolyzing) [Myxococcota bacterium]
MCGIGGVLAAPGVSSPHRRELETMREGLRHRGPDDSGIFEEGRAGLCHTRLAVLDLSPQAAQPMISSNRRYVLCFNGEIYNYRSLRDELRQAGLAFRTDGDSEVILALMESGGQAALTRLKGMFAIALYDRESQNLLLMRDRLGIKPLFYQMDETGLRFASEPKALKAATGSPSSARVGEYLAFRHAAESESLLPEIRTLLPGQALLTDGRNLEFTQWWSAGRSPDGASLMTSSVVENAVRRQLVSDVPVGVFLSGGVDSALVTAAASDALPSLDTFTVGFQEAGWDESARSRVVSEACGTKSHVIQLTPSEYVADLGRAIWHLDSPLNHAHSVHLLRLAHFARQRVTVALTGEGGDELFGGYPRYRLARLAFLLSDLPGVHADWLRRRAGRWGPRAKRVFEAVSQGPVAAAAINSAFLPIEEAARLAGCSDVESVLGPRLKILEEVKSASADPMARLLALERRTYMVSLLQRMDRMSMAVGLECRVPLMDEAVFDHASSLSSTELVTLRDSKVPLRRAVEARFGRRYAQLPKSGFGVPVGAWLRADTAFRNMTTALIHSDAMKSRGWLDVVEAKRYLKEHCEELADHSEALWGIVNLELWARICVDGEGPEVTSNKAGFFDV